MSLARVVTPDAGDVSFALDARDGVALVARGCVKLRGDLVVSQQNTAAGKRG